MPNNIKDVLYNNIGPILGIAVAYGVLRTEVNQIRSEVDDIWTKYNHELEAKQEGMAILSAMQRDLENMKEDMKEIKEELKENRK